MGWRETLFHQHPNRLGHILTVNRTIWVVEDDTSAIFVYEDILQQKYQVRFFTELSAFVSALRETKVAPDLVISDLKLGDESFVNFLTTDESSHLLTMPFIVVSSIDDLEVLRLCFDEGAVEYLTKPFRKNELIVKIERLLSGVVPLNPHQIPEEGKIVIDAIARSVKRGANAEITLTTRQLQIFSLLEQARQKGCAIPRQEVEKEIWGNVHVTDKTLDVHIFHLRKRLKELGIQIVFDANKGYKLEMSHEPKI